MVERQEPRITALSDIVFNILAVMIIILVMTSFTLLDGSGVAPTRNRLEPPLLTVRDCYVQASRPMSRTILLWRDTVTLVDLDRIAEGIAQDDVPAEVTLSLPDQPADADEFYFELTVIESLESPRSQTEQLSILEDMIETEVYGAGYVPFFFVESAMVPLFAPVYHRLVAEGRSVRMELLHGSSNPTLAFLRTPTQFEDPDFCR